MSANLDQQESPPLHTRRFSTLEQTDLAPDAWVILAPDGNEQRGHLPLWDELQSNAPDRCVVIEKQGTEEISVRIRGGRPEAISLLDDEMLAKLFGPSSTYLDISGLGHHVWAPLFRAARASRVRLNVIYVEPERYKPHPSPASSTVFDLTTEFGGLAPLPGFTRLQGPSDETKTILVTMLGFEGSRPERLAIQVDTVLKVIPIIGVPGFRFEYPAYTVSCNRGFLEEYRAHGDIRFARASCPFEAFRALQDLKLDYPNHYIYIAPVGTKPHALGAVWFALENPASTELLYDHPVRKLNRTQGIGLTHVYEFQFK